MIRIDDLQVPGEQTSQQIDRPHLQCLRQQGVAGVGETLPGDLPRLFPGEAALVDQDAHQLRDGDHRVGVVELEDHPFRQPVQIEAGRQGVVDVVAQRAGHEEVLLLQPEFLALRRGILRVQDLADVLGEGLRPHRLQIVAGVEHLQVEGLGGARAPQPEAVHVAGAIPRDHVVVRDSADLPAVLPPGPDGAVLVLVLLGVSGEPDPDPHLRMRELPRRPVGQPGVGLLHLLAVLEGLPEDPVLVADPVSDRGDAHGRQRVDEAGGQPAESAVAKARFDLDGAQGVQVDAERFHRLLSGFGQAGSQ